MNRLSNYPLQAIMHCVSNRREFEGKTIACRRYKIEEGLFEGCRWQT
jgi:hypothetical protein